MPLQIKFYLRFKKNGPFYSKILGQDLKKKEGKSFHSLGMLFQYKWMPFHYNGIPFQYQGMPFQYKGMLFQYQGMPFQYQGMLFQYQGMAFQQQERQVRYTYSDISKVFYGLVTLRNLHPLYNMITAPDVLWVFWFLS